MLEKLARTIVLAALVASVTGACAPGGDALEPGLLLEEGALGASCTHTFGGSYADLACSASYQCCGGRWRTRASGCGSCACVEPTGRVGCDGVVGDGARADAGPSLPVPSPPPVDVPPPPPSPPSPSGARVVRGVPSPLLFELENAVFDGTSTPDVAVHVPDGLDLDRSPGVVVFFHGWRNCVRNAIGATDTRCRSGGPVREALHLAEQLDAANVNAVLVVVQLGYDLESSNAGTLSSSGQCRALLDEALGTHLRPHVEAALGPAARVFGGIDDFASVVLASHSGGYVALARCLDRGGLTNVREVQLYDSLYGERAAYESWIRSHRSSFVRGRPGSRRFSTVSRPGTGPATQSNALGSNAEGWVPSGSLLHDASTGTLGASDLETPVIVKASALSHFGIPLTYFELLLRASELPRR